MRHPLRTAVAAALAAGALVGCSTGSTGSSDAATDAPSATTSTDAGAFPVTIEHAYGETVIDAEPTRVATLGWSDQDVALALGVVPVGAVAISWGGNEAQSTPWFDAALEELGGEQPTRYADTDGAPIDEIAQLEPDLILATNSGLTEQEYAKLSKIADVVAFPDEPWLTDWEDSLEMAGAALGRTELAEQVEDETEAAIEDAAAAHPQLAGKSFVFASLATADMSKIDYYTPADSRPQLLSDVGMVNAPYVEEISKDGEFYGSVSAEQAPKFAADVFITYAEKEGDLAAFRRHPLLGRIPGIRDGHVLAATNQTDALGLSAPSPLAIPYAMEHFLPLVAAAVDGDAGTS